MSIGQWYDLVCSSAPHGAASIRVPLEDRRRSETRRDCGVRRDTWRGGVPIAYDTLAAYNFLNHNRGV